MTQSWGWGPVTFAVCHWASSLAFLRLCVANATCPVGSGGSREGHVSGKLRTGGWLNGVGPQGRVLSCLEPDGTGPSDLFLGSLLGFPLDKEPGMCHWLDRNETQMYMVQATDGPGALAPSGWSLRSPPCHALCCGRRSDLHPLLHSLSPQVPGGTPLPFPLPGSSFNRSNRVRVTHGMSSRGWGTAWTLFVLHPSSPASPGHGGSPSPPTTGGCDLKAPGDGVWLTGLPISRGLLGHASAHRRGHVTLVCSES